jgi:hypothetical protein
VLNHCAYRDGTTDFLHFPPCNLLKLGEQVTM